MIIGCKECSIGERGVIIRDKEIRRIDMDCM